ncbi:MAG: hypothetical protein LBM04_08270 [Opitutaceae bacterium]|nr:hypothetical protein [Opitutaceae bacterium]
MTSVNGSCGSSPSICPTPSAVLICASSLARSRRALYPCPCLLASRSKSSLALDIPTPLIFSITPFASPVGILLTINAAISCIPGVHPPCVRPSAWSAGYIHS